MARRSYRNSRFFGQGKKGRRIASSYRGWHPANVRSFRKGF